MRLWIAIVMNAALCCALSNAQAAETADAGTGVADAGPGAAAIPQADLPSYTLDPRDGLRRGSPVRLSGSAGFASGSVVTLAIGGVVVGEKKVTHGGPSLDFVIPVSGPGAPPLGSQRALLTMAVAGKPSDTVNVGPVQLLGDPPSFAVESVRPATVYPDGGAYTFVVTGSGFSDIADDHHLLIDGQEIAVCWTSSPAVPCATAAVGASPGTGHQKPARPIGPVGVRVSDHELRFVGLPASGYSGPVSVQVRLGNGTPSPAQPLPLTFSRLPRYLPQLIGVVLTTLLFLIVFLLVRRSAPIRTSEGFVVGPAAALLLDKETESYSLSRLQFYLWTAVAIFGYTSLAIAKTLVQGKLELPDIPGTLPGIIAISSGTSVAAVGITYARGPKGTGAARPSFADLISVGGVVVPERFQFLIWTFVAVLGFLLVVVLSDPATADTLPALPEGFLYLSGISASGYLAGKLTRAPGPVVDGDPRISTDSDGTKVHIEVNGRNFSSGAIVRLANVDVGPYLASSERMIQPVPTADGASGRAASQIVVNLVKVAAAWRPGSSVFANVPASQGAAATPAAPRRLSLSITNPDGQSAETFVQMSTGVDDVLEKLPRA